MEGVAARREGMQGRESGWAILQYNVEAAPPALTVAGSPAQSSTVLLL